MKTRVPKSTLLLAAALLAMLPAAASAGVMPASTASSTSGRVISTPRIPLRFEPCLPVTCGASNDWSYVGLGGRYSVLVGAKKIALLRPGASPHFSQGLIFAGLD